MLTNALPTAGILRQVLTAAVLAPVGGCSNDDEQYFHWAAEFCSQQVPRLVTPPVKP